jgi:hypothetical protein
MTTSSDLHSPTPQSVAAYVKRNTGRVKKTLAGMAHHGPAVSVREANHNGHHILIRTTYEISVDRRPVMGEFLVTDEGQVQCHALPNYTFLSAVDLVKSLIDLFPEDFERPAKGGHSMHGMSMPMGRGRSKAGRKGGKARARGRKKSSSSRRATTRPRSRKGS